MWSGTRARVSVSRVFHSCCTVRSPSPSEPLFSIAAATHAAPGAHASAPREVLRWGIAAT